MKKPIIAVCLCLVLLLGFGAAQNDTSNQTYNVSINFTSLEDNASDGETDGWGLFLANVAMGFLCGFLVIIFGGNNR